MSVLSTQALGVLSAHGCIRTDATVDRKRVATLLIDELKARHVAHTVADVGQVELDAGALTTDVFGQAPADLVELVKPLLATGPDGAVQAGLADGVMLCGSRVSVEVQVGGELKRVNLTTRFLSDDGDVIEEFLTKNRTRRAEAAADANRRLGALITSRLPALAGQVNAWTADLEITYRNALTQGQP
jgi:hypothetical protein